MEQYKEMTIKMTRSTIWRLWIIFVLVSPFYCEKVNKKSAIVVRHHTEKCEDYSAVSKKCHMWKDLGFCFKHRKEMQFVCSNTCKFCDPGQSHWTYTVTPDGKADTKTNIPMLNKLSPTLEVMGKKKALYLSSKDIAGMLQTLSSKDYGVGKPTPTPKELAVIQGRIQKLDTSGAKINATKAPTKEPQIKPQANVGGKLQVPPPEKEGEKAEPKNGEKEHSGKADAPEKPQEKLTVTGSKEIDNKLVNLMNNLVSGSQDKEAKSADDKDKKPEQTLPKDIQITIPDLLKVLQKISGKSISDKENRTKEQAGSSAKEQQTDEAGRNKEPETDAKSKALLAAMRLVKAVGPLPAGVLNNSNIMDQLKAAAEEASVAIKLLNKTAPEKEKEKTAPVGDGNVTYNVQLLQEELNKHLNNKTGTAEPVAKADSAKDAAASDLSSNNQLGKFIVSLQDTINAQQGQPSAATSITGRGGVAVKEDEGKPTLSEVIPFDIKIDSDSDSDSKKETPVEFKGAKKDKQQSMFESDEQKIMKILNGLDQKDSNKKKSKDDGSKEIVKDIRTAYEDLGEIINGAEQDEGIKKTKKKKEENEEEAEDGDTKEEKKKKRKDEKDEKDEMDKKKKDKDDEDEKKKKKKNGDDDDENEFYNPYDEEPKRKKKKKKRKALTRKDHLQKVLSFIKKAKIHLEKIGAKRVKDKKQSPEDEEADTRTRKEKQGTDWKKLATKLARQLGLVLKKMAEKDQKLLAERNRLQGVLATLAQSETRSNEGNTETRADDDGDDDDDDEDNEENRSKIIHGVATKLLSFSKTVNEAQRSNHLRTPRRKKRIFHNLVSRYGNLVNKILANWVQLKSKGKKKSGIPKQGAKSEKRGEILRNKGNSTTNASHSNIKPTQTVKIAETAEQNGKDAKKKNGIPDDKTNIQTQTETVTEGEQDVLEVANK